MMTELIALVFMFWSPGVNVTPDAIRSFELEIALSTPGLRELGQPPMLIRRQNLVFALPYQWKWSETLGERTRNSVCDGVVVWTWEAVGQKITGDIRRWDIRELDRRLKNQDYRPLLMTAHGFQGLPVITDPGVPHWKAVPYSDVIRDKLFPLGEEKLGGTVARCYKLGECKVWFGKDDGVLRQLICVFEGTVRSQWLVKKVATYSEPTKETEFSFKPPPEASVVDATESFVRTWKIIGEKEEKREGMGP